MSKSLSFFGVFIAVGAVVVGVTSACSDSPSGSSFTETFPDSGPQEGGPGFDTDARVDTDSGPVSCEPALSASYHTPPFTPPVKASTCSTGDITGYYDTCYADPHTKECTDWLAAHKACGDCIEGPGGPVIVVTEDRTALLLNRAGCIAIQLKAKDAGAETCSAAIDAALQCRRASCSACFAAGQTSQHALQIFNQCGGKANDSGCQQQSGAVGPACASVDAATNATCEATAAEQTALSGSDEAKADAALRSFVTRVMGASCAP